jgi:hypothetical protein
MFFTTIAQKTGLLVAEDVRFADPVAKKPNSKLTKIWN